jgi:CRP-like cAMP-binding protein
LLSHFNMIPIGYIEQFKTFASTFINFDKVEWENFEVCLHLRRFKIDEAISPFYKTENYLNFVCKGIIRAYRLDESGNEVSLYFNFDNEFSSSYDSFLMQQPSLLCLQAITEVACLSISYSDLQTLYAASIKGERFGRMMAENAYKRRVQREYNLLALSAEEKYNELKLKQPELIESIPQKYLASYIGITPQSLSRLKKKN